VVEIIDALEIVVQKMGSADIDELLKAAALLAEQDCIALLRSETGKLVAAVGRSGLERGIKAGRIIKAAAKQLGGGGGQAGSGPERKAGYGEAGRGPGGGKRGDPGRGCFYIRVF
jgi:alanyl-tRNA synthetase